MHKALLMIMCCAITLQTYAKDISGVPPLPNVPDEESGTETSNANTNDVETVSYDFVWDVDKYTSLNWSSWDTTVSTWFNGLATIEQACLYPPTPPEMFFGIGQELKELPVVFNAITNDIPAVLVEGIPTWGVNVRERVDDATKKREFLTIVGHSIVHTSPVPSSFNPEAWSLRAYNNGQPLPDWINNDADARATWFSLRGRERLGMAHTFVAPGRMKDLQRALQIKAEEERLRREMSQTLPNSLSFINMDFSSPQQILFNVYNPRYVALGLLTQVKLGDAWDYRGQIPASLGYGYVGFPFRHLPENDPRFFRVVDLTTDSDRDGLPDGLEVTVFKTDPNKRDTTDCGMDDWLKIYLYDLDPTIPDNDHDGILDGEDELPTIAGPEITIFRPSKNEEFTVSSLGTFNLTTSGNVMPVTGVTGETPKLAALWVNGVNKIPYDNPAAFQYSYHFSDTKTLTPGVYSIVVEAEQDGHPRLRSRKFVNITVRPRGPELVVIEPKEDAQLYDAHLAVKVRVEEKDTMVWCNDEEMQSNNYYRFHILHFTEADLDQTKTIRLKAVASTGEITIKLLKVTIHGLRENEILIDHILNTGSRVFDGTLDGATLKPEDFSEDGGLKL